MKNIHIIETDIRAGKYWAVKDGKDAGSAGEMKQVTLFPEETDTGIEGFGGAFTEAAAHTYAGLDPEKQKELIRDLFGQDGLRYTMGRIHMNSCDFALGNYTYIKEGDTTLDSFDLSHDEQEIIPMIQAAGREMGKQPVLMMAPWSPPAFMKTNGEMNHGGKLKAEYADVWARYYVRFMKEMKERGLQISYTTVQNEPMATQTWDSCIYTARDEADFVSEHLGPAMKEAGILEETKIFVWDHNKEIAYDRLKEILAYKNAKDYVSGCAVHWYTGDHFENLQLIRRHFPDCKIFFTEGCVEYSILADASQVQNAEMYAHQMGGNLNSGCNAILDWNLMVDFKGGPNHVGNFCDAPIKATEDGKDYVKQLSYYYIGHFSRYIKEGAKHMIASRYTDKIDVSAFVNPDGERVAVLLNKGEETLPCTLAEKGGSLKLELAPHSIVTVTYEA